MVRRGVPRVFRWRAPVWQADVDAFGELHTTAALRLLQEVATRASTDAGFAPSYYAGAGTMWLVRRTTLERLAPARYGDDLEVTTWIADFRRVRSRRDYELRCKDRLILRAHTDWVYVDAQGRPRRVPADMQQVFAPEGATSLARVPFADENPPASAPRRARRVEVGTLDALAHVNNAQYAAWVEQEAHEALVAAGWPLGAQLAAGGRLRAVAHDLEYLDSALPDEELAVVSRATVAGAEVIERLTWVERPGDAKRPLLRARSRYVWTRTVDETPSAIPPSLRMALASG